MTPQQRRDKWREEAVVWLEKLSYIRAREWSDEKILNEIKHHTEYLNYLTIEYINVKHAEDDTTEGA